MSRIIITSHFKVIYNSAIHNTRLGITEDLFELEHFSLHEWKGIRKSYNLKKKLRL